MVVVGETLIAVPLVIDTKVLSAESETDPLPLANTPVSAAVPPEAITFGFAVKLVMLGPAGVDEPLPPPPQATKPRRLRPPAKTHACGILIRFMTNLLPFYRFRAWIH